MQELAYRKQQNPVEFFEPMPQQKAFADDPAKIKLLVGGNRSGKTEAGAAYVVTKCLAKPRQRWWCAAENYKDSINIQQRKIWSFLPKSKIKYAEYSEERGFTHEKVVFKNRSVIIFKSYEQQRKAFQSDDVDGIWNDEEPPYDIYREERMRLIDRDGEMIFTMTSLKGITQLLEEVFDGYAAIKTRYSSLLKEILPVIVEKEGIRTYMLWSTDNTYVNQSRVLVEVKTMTREEVKARIFGIPVNLRGRIYPQFNDNVHVVDLKDVPWKDCSYINVVDPHDRKPWAIIWAAVDGIGNVYIVHEDPFGVDFNEIPYGDKTYSEYASLIHKVEAKIRKLGGTGHIDRIIDPNYGNTTVKLAERQGGQSKTTPKFEMAKHGLRYRDGIDALEAGHLKVREYLHYETKYDEETKQEEIIVRPKFFVATTCANTKKHLSRYARKDPETPGGDVKDKIGVMEKYKDFADLVRYLLMSNPRKRNIKKFVTPEGRAY